MLITTGRVNGSVIEIEGDNLPDGAKVTILAPENEETFEVSPQEEVALLAAIAEAQRGETLKASTIIEQISKL
jgi:hypothetical protein